MTQSIVVHSRTDALETANVVVQAIATNKGWLPETLIRRVKNALPARVEQILYLRLAESTGYHPESVAKMLRGILGSHELQARDMLDVALGENLSINRFAETLDLLVEIVAMTRSLREMYGSLSIDDATSLAKAYGPDHVEVIADSVSRYLSSNFDVESEQRLSMALHWLVFEGFVYCESRGVPYPQDFGEWLSDYPEAARKLGRYIGFPSRGRTYSWR